MNLHTRKMRVHNSSYKRKDLVISKSEVFEDVDIFLLRLVREKYGERIINQSIDWSKNEKILNIRLQLDMKEVLFRFHLTEGDIPFKGMKSNTFSINIKIGKLDSIEKYNLVKNQFHTSITSHLKGISNENYIFDVAKVFAEENNFEFMSSDELDNRGVDFLLRDKFSQEEFYFQIKSSWFYVERAKREGRGFYKEKEIIFLVKNKINKDFYGIISVEIKKQRKVV